ncbi:MAG TPA: hypothetical protein VFC00_13575 [Micromonosporaceae bacterium]|nr:hypothetical protein [Micromonosporaceae bacterium]
MTRLSLQIQLAQIEHLLRHIAEDYYTAAKAYHILRATGHPDRIRLHARLKTLAQVGNSLADALHCRRPPWHLFYDHTGRDPHCTANPFQAGGGCQGCPPVANPTADPTADSVISTGGGA